MDERASSLHPPTTATAVGDGAAATAAAVAAAAAMMTPTALRSNMAHGPTPSSMNSPHRFFSSHPFAFPLQSPPRPLLSPCSSSSALATPHSLGLGLPPLFGHTPPHSPLAALAALSAVSRSGVAHNNNNSSHGDDTALQRGLASRTVMTSPADGSQTRMMLLSTPNSASGSLAASPTAAAAVAAMAARADAAAKATTELDSSASSNGGSQQLHSMVDQLSSSSSLAAALARRGSGGSGSGSGGSGSGSPSRRFSFSFTQADSLLSNPSAMLLPPHSTPRSRNNSSTPSHSLQLLQALGNATISPPSRSSHGGGSAFALDAAGEGGQHPHRSHHVSGTMPMQEAGSTPPVASPRASSLSAAAMTTAAFAPAATQLLPPGHPQRSPSSRDSSAGDSWAINSMDLSNSAVFDAFPSGVFAGGSHPLGTPPHTSSMAHSSSPNRTGSFLFLSLHAQQQQQPQQSPFGVAKASPMSSGSFPSSLHSPPTASAAALRGAVPLISPPAGFLTPPHLRTPPQLSSLLAQANNHTSGGNRAFLQQQLEQIFLQNQREEELHRQLQQQAATLQQQQQFQLQFQRAAIDSNGAQHLRSPSQASPAQLSSPASVSASIFSERTTSEAVVQAAALASSAPPIQSQQQVRSPQQHTLHHQQQQGSPQQQQQPHSFSVASPVHSVLLASPPSATAHAAACASIPSRLSANAISYAPSIASRPAGSSLSTLRHNKGGPFECDACGKTFTQRGGLQNHLRIHANERPFACQWPGCDKAFAQKCNLTRHSRIHTGEKPYKCAVCPRSFNRRYGLIVHSRAHGRDVPVMNKQKVRSANRSSSGGGKASSRSQQHRQQVSAGGTSEDDEENESDELAEEEEERLVQSDTAQQRMQQQQQQHSFPNVQPLLPMPLSPMQHSTAAAFNPASPVQRGPSIHSATSSAFAKLSPPLLSSPPSAPFAAAFPLQPMQQSHSMERNFLAPSHSAAANGADTTSPSSEGSNGSASRSQPLNDSAASSAGSAAMHDEPTLCNDSRAPTTQLQMRYAHQHQQPPSPHYRQLG